MPNFNQEITYLILFSAVLILPKLMRRLRLPEGISCILLGLLSSYFWESFQEDQLLLLLSRLGITSLFLFAGMEVDIKTLKTHSNGLLKHLSVSLIMMGLCSAFLANIFHLPTQVAIIFSLGLLTPSTGFILESIKDFRLSEGQKYWISSKSIAEEILAVMVLFIALQSNDMQKLGMSLGVLIFLLLALPLIFKIFLKFVAPYAPKSEVAFLILLALICGVVTKKIGTYYLVGAFIVGIIAGRFKHFLGKVEGINIFNSLSIFFGIFIPFYFFKAGLSLSGNLFNKESLLIGIGFAIFIIPMRNSAVFYSQKNFISDKVKRPWKVALSLMPTLIFGLVIASILRDRFEVKDSLIGGLFIYTLISSFLPAFAFERLPPKRYTSETVTND